MKKVLLSLLVSGVILGATLPVQAQNMPFDGPGAAGGKTGWTKWERIKLASPLTRHMCYREYYKNGKYHHQQIKDVWFWQSC
ncbi:hypothetical protein [Buttiauxella sp. A111]|uniref:hypothetical protein n=1 Tax=Buttiauxella sp. A111 TaxID=2563088 RepID=UPI0010E2E324|nr:hypothetical protein [Buttiauxella sp. A111]GDX08050.1 hypothetical protein BSPA111_42770 [Buttiauxella sp. A111]